MLFPDEDDFFSGKKSMKIVVSKEGITEAIKTFALPEGAPFVISQNKFRIVDRLGMHERIKNRLRTRRDKSYDNSAVMGSGGSGIAVDENVRSGSIRVIDSSLNGSGESGELRMMSVGTVGIYYIYAFDGKLLAEYDGYGQCLWEYIYIGAKMVAEY